jgi:hypothetical protein
MESLAVPTLAQFIGKILVLLENSEMEELGSYYFYLK